MGSVCVENWSQDFVEAADEAGIMVIQEMPFGVGPRSDPTATRSTPE